MTFKRHLAQIIIEEPDFLILDEPTNHLDLDSIEWLEHRVKNYLGAVLFITHDRRFLEQLATRIAEIDRGKIRNWPGNYRRYHCCITSFAAVNRRKKFSVV